MEQQLYQLHRGEAPLVVTMPHLGTYVPQEISQHFTEDAQARIDTDWHLDRLYNFVEALGATVIRAEVSRYVVDLNRPPSNESLYPGQVVTSLCPTETFDGKPVYQPGYDLTDAEIARRKELYWQPWHDCVAAELERLKAKHERVVLWDAHSIRSLLPLHFEGRLPDFNIGTNSGRSCDKSIVEPVLAAVREAAPLTHILNGRYKGGYITRHYGDPDNRVHAVQMELAQACYMTELSPDQWDDDKAVAVRRVLERILRSYV
ncbi:N-formylglutamate deformylase [Marinobacterium lutimaris]|uniref:N-formylglutamate deformylase n=1 Tax=Marinobacterium lutimaris TaxID=568106 RepID=A0A1H5TV19_9GAMM|nr:N-formylglutamate deformylase [Marinobacterium lutimaris]SEF66675.1 N-formylglutamate deformylase [Marinobacterium lutimaris]